MAAIEQEHEGQQEEQWTPEKEDKLVAAWQLHSCLFDITSPENSNRVLKEKAWQEIAAEVEMPVAQIKKRTSSLRTQYSKARKPQPSGSARKSVSRKTQWILDNLQFLDPFIAEKKSTSNLDRPCTPSADEGSDAEDDTNRSENGSEDSTPSAKRGLPFSKRGKEKTLKKIREEEELSILKGLAQSLENEKRDEPGDESETFGLYVSQCLKKMDERARIIARHQIQNVIFQAQAGALSAAPHQSNMNNLYQESYTGLLQL